MNLTKLFNMKYFMQNVKKSKMAIVLFLAIVPIFTALTIITMGKENMLEFWKIGLANIIFMYITPFVLSVVLFGYVYKKKSIDFIGSMPISRKTIFVTNTLGGMALIVLSQLVTFLISILANTIVGGTVFVGMLWDIFIYQSIAYIFVFTISNLAMSLSGNILTQIVTTLLITFLISSGVAYFDLWNSGNSYTILDESGLLYGSVANIRSYTAPSAVFGCSINGMSYEYSNISIIKMLTLSIAYIIIGYVMFNKKIMETAGESFQNKYVHLFIKGLTLIPFAMILVPLAESGGGESIIFIIAIIAVYYFIYDLITNKKNKVLVNLVAMAISILMLFGVYDVISKIATEAKYTLDFDDIKSVTIKNIAYNTSGLNIEIEDKDLIEEIITYENGYNSSQKYLKMEINLKNGIKKLYTTRVGEDVVELILSNANLEDFEVKKIDCTAFKKDDKEAVKNLKVALNNAIKTNGIKDIYKRNSLEDMYIYAYNYTNHSIRKSAYPINISKDVFTIVTKTSNQNAANYIRKRENSYIYISIEDDIEYYGNCPNELRDFIIGNSNKTCKFEEKYICIKIEENRYYTNDIEKVKKIINRNTQKIYDYEEYPTSSNIEIGI